MKNKKDKKETVVDLVVKVTISHDEEANLEDVVDEVVTECNYYFGYRKNGIHIIRTEIKGTKE